MLLAGLPGLVVLALAAVLAVLLARGERPPMLLVVSTALVVVWLFASVLFAGRVLLPLDTLRGFLPFTLLAPVEPHGNFLQQDLVTLIAPSLAAVRQAFAHGEWPLWNGLAGLGVPLLADPQAQALQPLALFALGLGVPAAAGAAAAARVLLATLFAGLLLRRLLAVAPGTVPRVPGLEDVPATLGAVAYGLGGFCQLWLGWPLANAAALLPVVLWAILGVTAEGGTRARAWLIAALAALLLAGQPEVVVQCLGFAGLFAVWRLTLVTARPRQWQIVRGLLGSAALAALIAAPALVPSALYLPDSERYEQLRIRTAEGWRETASDESWQALAVRRLVPLVAPNAHGNDRYLAYWGAQNINEDAAGFVGTGTLLLALLAVAGGSATSWRRGERQLLGATLMVALVIVARPPAFLALHALLPPFLQSSSLHHRVLLLVDLATVWLAARGLQAWLADQQAGRERWQWLGLAALGVALPILLTWSYLAHPPPEASTLLAFRHGWLARQLKFLAVTVALLALARAVGARSLVAGWRTRAASYGILLAVAGELLLVHQPANPPQPARLAFPVTPALQAAADALSSAPAGTRILGLGDHTLPPNLAAIYGLADPRAYNPSAPAASAELSAELQTAVGDDPRAGGAWAAGGPELRHGAPVAAPRPVVTLLDELAVGVFLTPTSRVPPVPADRVFDDGVAAVWVRRTMPANAMLEGRRALSAVPVKSPTLAGPRLELAVPAASAAGRLTISIAGVAGWTALSGGGPPLPTQAAGGRLGVDLPAGVAELTLIYRPPGLLLGAALAAAGWAMLAAWLSSPPHRATPGRGD